MNDSGLNNTDTAIETTTTQLRQTRNRISSPDGTMALSLHNRRIKDGVNDALKTITIGLAEDRLTGHPAAWEGGGRDNTCGGVMLIAGPLGQKLPVFVGYRRNDRFVNGRHGLIPVDKSYLIAFSAHEGDYQSTLIYRVTEKIFNELAEPKLSAKLQLVTVYNGSPFNSSGELVEPFWIDEMEVDDLSTIPTYVEFVKATWAKAHSHSCNELSYGIPWRRLIPRKGEPWSPPANLDPVAVSKIENAGNAPISPREQIKVEDWLVFTDRLSSIISDKLFMFRTNEKPGRAHLALTITREKLVDPSADDRMVRMTIQPVLVDGVTKVQLIKTWTMTFMLTDDDNATDRPTWPDGSPITIGLMKKVDADGRFRCIYDYTGC